MGLIVSSSELETLRQLEVALWRSETRFDAEYQEQIFAPDSFEFGRSGRRYKRSEMILVDPKPINARLPLDLFHAHMLAPDVALVTYVSEVTNGPIIEISNRSSLWVRTGETWQLQFHQGTAGLA